MAGVALSHNVFPAAWSGLVLALLVVAAAVGPRFGRWGGAALTAVSVWWLFANKRMEGGTLITVVPGSHGLVAADLAGLTGLVIGAWLLLRGRL
jgi:hypothetical protein